jgi:hypothetical protein
MDAVPLFLLLLLPPADTTGDTAAGIQASLRRELGDVAVAITPDTLATPAMWRGAKAQLRARFVAKVEWTTKDQARVELIAPAFTKDQAQRTRVLAFAPQDSQLERGRAIGLVLAELLREAPASAFAISPSGGSAAQAESPTRLHLTPAALFASQRAMSGNWAVGPELRNGFGLGQAWWLQVSGWALFGSADQYASVGLGLALRWDVLRTSDGRHALGVGLGGDFFRESAPTGGEASKSLSVWNLAPIGSLAGRVTLWRWLRLVGQLDMRVAVRTLSVTTGDDEHRLAHSYSHWRPGFALGLELAM